MARFAQGQQIDPSFISILAPGVFTVKSFSTGDKVYTVSFDVDGMPHCDCFDWQCYHMPCKHFCAIFINYENYGWDSLATPYRDSNFFKLDADIVGEGQEKAPPTGADLAYAEDASNWIEERSSQELLSTEVGGKSVKHMSASCRELLTSITNLTYLMQDCSCLENLYNDLQRLHDKYTPAVPGEDGILLENCSDIPLGRRKMPGKRGTLTAYCVHSRKQNIVLIY